MTNYLYSIQSPYVAPIMNGDKTKELRKSVPHEMVEAIKRGEKVTLWLYCTKGKPYLYYPFNRVVLLDKKVISDNFVPLLNGLVVAKCVVDDYIEYQYYADDNIYFPKRPQDFNKINAEELLKGLCITRDEFKAYGNKKDVCVLRMSKLEILDKPLQVSDFFNPNLWMLPHEIYAMSEENKKAYRLTRAPQSYQKVIPPEVRK